MSIDSIRVNTTSNQYVLVLHENERDCYLPIWIGPVKANAIAMQLQGIESPRPLTHDLLISVIDNLGASLDSIVVSDIQSDTFYARLILHADGQQLELDSRPSDAMALAVRVGAPVYAEETVVDQAGILIDPETGALSPTGRKTRVQGHNRSLTTFQPFVMLWKPLILTALTGTNAIRAMEATSSS